MSTHSIYQQLLLPLLLAAAPLLTMAQGEEHTAMRAPATDSHETIAAHREEIAIPATMAPDSVSIIDSLLLEQPLAADSLLRDSLPPIKPRRDWTIWKPNPKRAMWLALVFPGAGQIYNRKYWKLPIFYGGFVGCAYAMTWNNQMYTDYRQAYLDLMDDDDSTHSYDQFMHLGNTIDDSNRSRYESLFSKRKDRFRRYRDISFFCILAVYALSVIDAYVDASLSQFDISDDLSMQIEPAYVNTNAYKNPLKGGGLGVQCSLSF